MEYAVQNNFHELTPYPTLDAARSAAQEAAPGTGPVIMQSEDGKSWIPWAATPATTALPAWHEMSDLDRGAALMHTHKRRVEGASYAVENYPAEYFDDPRLLALNPADASDHAAEVAYPVERDTSTRDECIRLYDLALAADRARYAARRPGA